MTVDEMELYGRARGVEPLPPEIAERAETILRAAVAVAQHMEEPPSTNDRPGRTRRWPVLGGVAAAVLVVAGIVGGTILATGSGQPRTKSIADSTHAERPTTRPPTAARLVAKVTAALNDVSGDISYSQQVEASGWTIDSWLSPDGNTTRTTTYDNGVENSDLTFTVSGTTQSATVVDYTDHAWWSYTEPTPPQPGPGCKLPFCGDVANGGLPPGPTNGDAPVSAAGVQWLLSGSSPGGNFAMVNGTQVVNGVDTYEITRSLGSDGTRSIWIDQGTNLPVQEQTSGDTNPNNNETTNYSWLPPTSSNLAQLQVMIPSDFTHSANPITSPVPPGGGVG